MHWFDGQNWSQNSILNGRILELGSEDKMPKVVKESSKATNNDGPRTTIEQLRMLKVHLSTTNYKVTHIDKVLESNGSHRFWQIERIVTSKDI